MAKESTIYEDFEPVEVAPPAPTSAAPAAQAPAATAPEVDDFEPMSLQPGAAPLPAQWAMSYRGGVTQPAPPGYPPGFPPPPFEFPEAYTSLPGDPNQPAAPAPLLAMNPALARQFAAGREAELAKRGILTIHGPPGPEQPIIHDTFRFGQQPTLLRKLAAGSANAGIGAVESLTAPMNLLPFLAGERFASAFFTPLMAAGAAQSIPATYGALKEGDYQRAAETATGGALSAGLSYLAGKHLIKLERNASLMRLIDEGMAREKDFAAQAWRMAQRNREGRDIQYSQADTGGGDPNQRTREREDSSVEAVTPPATAGAGTGDKSPITRDMESIEYAPWETGGGDPNQRTREREDASIDPADMVKQPEPPPGPPLVNAQAALAGSTPRTVPASEIVTLPELMQFKKMDDPAAGTNKTDELTGAWDPYKAGNLLLWEPIDPAAYGLKPGQKYVVANGHHRFAFGQSQGVKEYSGQVLREADGFSAPDARRLGAEINIADGKGTIYDQAIWFRDAARTLGANEALAAGERIGARGRKAANIAFAAGDNTWSAFINERISPDHAEAIATAAPGNDNAQRVGIHAALKKFSPQEAANMIRASLANHGPAWDQIDLFGGDDGALRRLELEMQASTRLQADLDQRIRAIQGAARNPELAATEGIDIRDPAALERRLAELKGERRRWQEWHKHPDLAKLVRDEVDRAIAGEEQGGGVVSEFEREALGDEAPPPPTPPTPPGVAAGGGGTGAGGAVGSPLGAPPPPPPPPASVSPGTPLIPAGTQVTGVGRMMRSIPRLAPGRRVVGVPAIFKTLEQAMRAVGTLTPIRTGRMGQYKRWASGFFRPRSENIRLDSANNIPTAVHEVAHAVAKMLFRRTGRPLHLATAGAVKNELFALGHALYGSRRPAAGYVEEGFSELMRHYLTTEDASRLAPNATRWFETEVLGKNPEFAKQIQRAREQIDLWRTQGALDTLRAQRQKASRWREFKKQAKQEGSFRALVEEAQPLEQIAKIYEQRTGDKLPHYNDPNILFQSFRGTTGKVWREMYEEGMIDINGTPTGGGPLKDAFSIVGPKHMEDFWKYLWARRSIERWSHGKNPGMSIEEAQSVYRLLDSPKFQLAADKYFQWWEGLLDYYADSSPYAKWHASVIRKGSQEYVPLFRVLPESWSKTVESSRTPGGLYKMSGSGLPIQDVYEGTIKQAHALIAMAHRERVRDSVFRLGGLSSPHLETGDIRSPNNLVRRLREKNDPATTWLNNQLGGTARTLLAAAKPGERPDPNLTTMLRMTLNHAISTGGGMPPADVFTGGRMRTQTRKLLAKATRTPEEQMRLNRLLIEDAFHGEIGENSYAEGMGALVEEVPRDLVHKTVSIQKIRDELEAQGVDTSAVPDDYIFQYYQEALNPRGPDSVSVRKGPRGKDQWFALKPEIYDLIEGLNGPAALHPVVDWTFGKAARAITLGNTGLRAGFGLAYNPVRDLLTMPGQTHYNPAHLPMAYLQAMVDSFRNALAEYGLGTPSEVGKIYQRLGIAQANRVAGDIKATRQAIRGFGRGKLMQRMLSPVDSLRDLIQIPENFPRIAELRMAMKAHGWKPGDPITPQQALEWRMTPRRVTTDFSAKGRGQIAGVARQIIPFWGAAVQGARSFARSFKRDRGVGPTRTARRVAAQAGLYGGLLSMWSIYNWWKNKDRPWYRGLPPRERFLYTMVEGKNGVVHQIPRPVEWGNAFMVLPEALMDSWYQRDPDSLKKALGHILETQNPGITPGAMTPIFEQFANRQFFFDRPIVPEGERQLLPGEQVGPYSTKIARAFGKLAPKYISPRRVDHLVRSYLGGAGTEALNFVGLGAPGATTAADLVGLGSAESERKRESEPADIPIVGRFWRRGGTFSANNRFINEFYDLHSYIEARAKSKDLPLSGNEDDWRREAREGYKFIREQMNLAAQTREVGPRRVFYQNAAEEAERLVKSAERLKINH